jgi:hypothetical protein
MADFNLLPSELAPKTSFIKLSLRLKKIAFVGYILFLALVVTLFSIVFIMSEQVQEQNEKEETLLLSIKALKETEQRLILTQDRLSHARNILDKKNATNELFALKQYVQDLPENVFFSESAVSVDSFNTMLSLGSSDDLTNLLSKMYSSQMFSEIIMTSFAYSSKGNFGLSFKLKI